MHNPGPEVLAKANTKDGIHEECANFWKLDRDQIALIPTDNASVFQVHNKAIGHTWPTDTIRVHRQHGGPYRLLRFF